MWTEHAEIRSCVGLAATCCSTLGSDCTSPTGFMAASLSEDAASMLVQHFLKSKVATLSRCAPCEGAPRDWNSKTTGHIHTVLPAPGPSGS